MSPDRAQVPFDREALRYDASGLLPVIVQDAFSGRVLMLAWANAEAVEKTLSSGEAHFWSRSRRSLWHKGETSGSVLRVLSIAPDCDGDCLLLRVIPAGPACHTGATSCFDSAAGSAGGLDLGALERLVAARAGADPRESYTARLFAEGIERMAQKVGEEATEVVIAALAAERTFGSQGEQLRTSSAGETGVSRVSRPPDSAPEAPASGQKPNPRLVEEASDLLFHLMVLLQASGVTTRDLANELSARHQRGSRATDDDSAPLPDNSSRVTTMPPEPSEPTDPQPSGKRRA